MRDGDSGSDAMFDRGGKSVWHVLAQGPDELVVYQRSVRTRTRDFRASKSSDRYGRILSFIALVFNYTVTGTTI